MGCKEVEKALGLKDNMPERNRAVIKEKFAKISVFEDIFFALTIDGTFYGDERQKTAILMMIDDKKTLKNLLRTILLHAKLSTPRKRCQL